MTEPENLVLQLLREMRADMATKADVARLEKRLENKIADVDAKVKSLAADVPSDLLSVEKRLSERIAGLRHAVMEYHSTAIGHGVLFTELEERVRKIERHLNLSEHGYPTR